MKALVIGELGYAKQILKEDAIIHQEPDGSLYDMVIVDHALPALERTEVVPYLEKMYSYLREDGEIIVSAPSLEWLAKQIALLDSPGPEIYFGIYGAPEQPYRSGFTMLWLRIALENAGFNVRAAKQEIYLVHVNDKARQMIQNVIIGIKHAGDNPSSKSVSILRSSL